MVSYIENSKDFAKKINQANKKPFRANNLAFGKVAEFKINIQNLLHFYTIYNELSQRKTNKPTYNNIKDNKIPRNKFNQEMKDLYTENYKALMKETEEHTNKGKILHAYK